MTSSVKNKNIETADGNLRCSILFVFSWSELGAMIRSNAGSLEIREAAGCASMRESWGLESTSELL